MHLVGQMAFYLPATLAGGLQVLISSPSLNAQYGPGIYGTKWCGKFFIKRWGWGRAGEWGATGKSQGRVGDSRQSLSKPRPLASAHPQAEKKKHAPCTLGPLSGELEGQSPEIFVWAKQPGASISAFRSETVYCKHQPRPQHVPACRACVGIH